MVSHADPQSPAGRWPTGRTGRCPIATHRSSIDEYTPGELATVVRWIESDTLLRTEEELLAEVMRVLGFVRRGSKITAALTAAIARARDLSRQSASSGPGTPPVYRGTFPPRSQPHG